MCSDQPVPRPHEEDEEGEGDDDTSGVSPVTGIGLETILERQPDESIAMGGGSGKGMKKGTKEKPQKKRNRKPSSCAQCRKKKLRCDRQSPCGACVLRGEPHLCSWEDAVPLLLGRADNDATELKAQVDRLQGLVDILTGTSAKPLPSTLINAASLFAQHGTHSSVPPSYNSPSASSSQYGSTSVVSNAYLSPTHPYNTLNTVNQPTAATSRLESMLSQFEHSDEPSRPGSPVERHDLKAEDLAEALSYLAISHLSTKGPASEHVYGQSGPVDLIEAQRFVGNNGALAGSFGLANQPFTGAGGSYVGGIIDAGAYRANTQATESVHRLTSIAIGQSVGAGGGGGWEGVLQCMPDDKQANSAFIYYQKYLDWYLHPIHIPSFQLKWHAMRACPLTESDAFFVATLLAVVGMSVAMMPVQRAMRDGFGPPQQRDQFADRFLQGSLEALTVGRFLEKPSLEAIRAILILNTYYVFMDSGEQTGSGMGLLALAVQIALQLGLHRDPDKTPGKYNPIETEDRRRLFWTLCSFETLASSALGRSYSIFNLDNVDTKFPKDLDDEDITEYGALRDNNVAAKETVMTSLIIRMRIGVIAKRISDRAFGIHPVSYATVMELDRELRNLEHNLPTQYQLRYDEVTGTFALPASGTSLMSLRFYMIHIALQQEYLRLHRPFLIKANTSVEMAASRAICVRAARVILAIQRQPACQQNWAGLLYKSMSSAVVLSLDLLQDPHSQYAQVYRAEIQAIIKTLQQFVETSTLCRKGAKVLGFLMEREQANVAANRERPLKRTRHTIPHATSGSTLVFSMALPPWREPSPDAMPHKTPTTVRGSMGPPLEPSQDWLRHASVTYNVGMRPSENDVGSSNSLAGAGGTTQTCVFPRQTLPVPAGNDSIPASSIPTDFSVHTPSVPHHSSGLPTDYPFDFTQPPYPNCHGLQVGNKIMTTQYTPPSRSQQYVGSSQHGTSLADGVAVADGTALVGSGVVPAPTGLAIPNELKEWNDLGTAGGFGIVTGLDWQGVLDRGRHD